MEHTAPGWVLTQSSNSDCLVAAAYVLQRQMQAHTKGTAAGSGQSFWSAIRTIVDNLCEMAEDMKNDPASDTFLIAGALSDLGMAVKEGRARVITTNYDDLIARFAELKVLLPDGRYFVPRPGQHTPEFIPPFGVPEKFRRIAAWQNISCTAADPAEVASVLHLHGWHGQEDAIVIDPVTYHHACKNSGDTVAADAYMRRECNLALAQAFREGPVIYYGVGEGMFDEHFNVLRQWAVEEELHDGKPPTTHPLADTNFWLLTQDEYDSKGQDWLRILTSSHTKPCSLTVVTVPGFKEMAKLLQKIMKAIL